MTAELSQFGQPGLLVCENLTEKEAQRWGDDARVCGPVQGTSGEQKREKRQPVAWAPMHQEASARKEQARKGGPTGQSNALISSSAPPSAAAC